MGAWIAPNFIVLTSDDSPLESGPISISQAALVVSILYIGGFIGTIIASLFTERFGRKIPLMVLPIPQIVRKLYIFKIFLYRPCRF